MSENSESIEKVILPEDMVHMSTSQLVELYRQGYQLSDGIDSLPVRRRGRAPPRRRGIMGEIDGGVDLENMLHVNDKEITMSDIAVGILGLGVGALVYYKLGKWEAKKLGWD